MTRDEILAMKPGRELDALVAEKVMGWAVVMDVVGGEKSGLIDGNIFSSIPSDWKTVPTYSTDISAAWEVVEKITQEYRITLYKLPGGEWSCKFSDFPQVIEPTAQEAICKAALLAVLEESH